MAWHLLFPTKAIRLCGVPLGNTGFLTTLSALTGAPVHAYLSAHRLRDHVQHPISVPVSTIQGSLTGSGLLTLPITAFIHYTAHYSHKDRHLSILNYDSFRVSHSATATALMPPASFPAIMAGSISGANPAVNPK